MKKIATIFAFILITISCGKDDPDPVIVTEAKGSIFVTVKFFGQVVADAQVSTEPATSMVETDLTGTAIISDVLIGGYKVTAYHPNIGTGSSSVTVKENEVMDVTINLIGGIFENPSANIIFPGEGSTHNLNEDISFSGAVDDSKDSPSSLSIEWKSDIDGVLNSSSANANGVTGFVTNSLTEGDHKITLKVTDSDMSEAEDVVNISVRKLPDAVVLNSIESALNGLSLSWSMSTEPDFSSYRILRAESANGFFDVVGVINDVNETSYEDASVLLGKTYYYQIVMALNNGEESTSNIESFLYEGDNIDVGVNVIRMIADPVRPYLYALDNINNSMLFINTETREVEKTIFVGSSPTDLDINLDNTTVYVANLGSTLIAVVDLESQEKVDDLIVDTQAGTWDGNPYSLVWLKGDYLAFTSEDQWNNIKVVNAQTGAYVSHAGSIHSPFLDSNPERTIVYGLDGSDAIRFNFSNGTLTEVDESNVSFGYRRNISVSRDGTYIFLGRNKVLANNLSSSIGTFGENIFECNMDGSIAISDTKIWNAEDFSIIRSLPIESEIMELDYDNETLYIYDINSSKIFIISIN